jgi:hypothetical protein
MGRQVRRYSVHESPGREDHVGRHGTGGTALEAVDVVRRAHPVLTPLAIAAGPTRHYLFRNHAVPDIDVPPLTGGVVELDHRADELVAGDILPLGPRRSISVSPKLGGAVVALEVTGTDADGFDPYQGGPRARLGDRDLLELVVLGSMAHDGLHELRHWLPLSQSARYMRR